MNFETTLSKFKIAKSNDNRYLAYCPAHNDKNASLSILVDNERILLHCHAGCDIDDILKSCGLTYDDLFSGEKPTNIYQYRDENGSLIYEKLRYKTKDGKTFRQRRIETNHIVDDLHGISKIPYNFPQVQKAIQSKSPILFVEGEKDAKTANLLGYTGTTFGGASEWKDEYKNYFKNANIILIPDKDEAGLKQADKIKNSLSTVCKSLKILILPDGKDLTEWVESGNSNIKSLIDSTVNTITTKGIPEPFIDVIPTGFCFDWNGLGLKITIDRIKGEDEAEITVFNNGNEVPDYISGIKLLSITHKTSLARALKEIRDLEWNIIVNQVTTKTLNNLRQGENVIMLDQDRGIKPPEYLLNPLFVKNSANVIYADRSSGKSLFTLMIDIILTLPWWDNDLGLKIDPDKRHNVLFLDWENDADVTGWQKECILRGANFEWCDLPYLKCTRPLHESVNHILSKISEVNADVVIIDSLGMAVGDDLNQSKPAFTFFSALRQLPVTPIIIAHTSKDQLNKRKTVYGNAFYENEARSVWEVLKEQEAGSNEMVLSIFQRKSPPFTGINEPMAWKFIFAGNKTIIRKTEPANDTRSKSYKDESISDIDLVESVINDSEIELTYDDIFNIIEGKVDREKIRVYCNRLFNHEKINKTGSKVSKRNSVTVTPP